MTNATRSSWKTLPLPSKREHLDLHLFFSDAEVDRMKQGFVPKDMDDRWFIFFEDGWFYFHRSWTGHCIFGARLNILAVGASVTDAWVNRDEGQYKSSTSATDQQLIRNLISNFLLT